MKVTRVTTRADHALSVALKELASKKVGKVGWFEKSRYPDEDATQVAYVAAQNEYGNPNKNIPARPFMRPTIAAQENTWKKVAEQGARNILKGNQTSGDALEMLGLKAAGDIKKTISKILTPPLAQSTINARLARHSDKQTVGKLTKPLIDTGLMFATLTNTVEDE